MRSSRPFRASLGAADAGIVVNLDHLPAAALGDLPKLAQLVLDRLVIGAYAGIDRGTLT
jgi:hypothetical protein